MGNTIVDDLIEGKMSGCPLCEEEERRHLIVYSAEDYFISMCPDCLKPIIASRKHTEQPEQEEAMIGSAHSYFGVGTVNALDYLDTTCPRGSEGHWVRHIQRRQSYKGSKE